MDSDNESSTTHQRSEGAPAEVKNMDFIQWIETHNLDPEIISCLKAEDMNDIEILKEFPVDDISSLELTPEHQAALRTALQSLCIKGNSIENELDTWAADNDIYEDTVQKLRTGGIVCMETLKQATSDDFKDFQIKAGQRVKLTKCIERLKDNEFVTYLREKLVKDETIRKLLHNEYESKETFRLMEKEHVNDLGISSAQQLLLLKLIQDLNTEQEKTKPLSDEEHSTVSESQLSQSEQTDPLPDNEFVTYLRDKEVKDDTIRLLLRNEYESKRMLTLIREKDIETLDVSSVQQRLVLRIVQDLKKEEKCDTILTKAQLCDLDGPLPEESGATNIVSVFTPPPAYSPPEDTLPEERASLLDQPLSQIVADSEFVTYLRDKEVKEATIRQLLCNEFESKETFKLMVDEDIDILEVSQVQKRLVLKILQDLKKEPAAENISISTLEKQKAVSTSPPSQSDQMDFLPENEFVTYLREGLVKDETIRKLLLNEYESMETFQLMEKEHINDLGISAAQRLLLLNLAQDLSKGAEKQIDSVEQAILYNPPLLANHATSEFMTYLRDKEVKEATIRQLLCNEFDSEETFKLMVEDDIDMLEVSLVQKRLVFNILQDLKYKHDANSTDLALETQTALSESSLSQSEQLDPLPDTEFVSYLLASKLNEETIRKLLLKEYESVETLFLMDEADVNDMQLSKPQRHHLLNIIEEVNKQVAKEAGKEMESVTYGQAFEQFLSSIDLDVNTIDELTTFGMDSPEALTLLEKENMDIMKLPSVQRIILEDAIDKLRKLDDDPDMARNIAKYTQSSATASNPVTVYDAAGMSTSSAQNRSRCSTVKEERPQDTFFSALGRWARATAGKTKTGIANAITYLKSAGNKTRPDNIRMVNGMRVVKLPVKQCYEDHQGKVRKCNIGKPNLKKQQKTIMVVGATGAGKSTLIDGLCNYIFDTKWEENNRFKLIDEHADELRNAAKGQTMSQTEWITIYTINSGESNRLPYTLNLIDTPGFGDTRGITRDQKLVEQIASLFRNRGKHGIDEIDAVCFVAKAPDARLTSTQRYIFNSILSVFGKDIEGNILVMITFADGARAPVLEAINAGNMPYKNAFPFNNSALFANNGIAIDFKTVSGSSLSQSNDATTSFGKMFWEMGIQSFKTFFDFVGTLTPKSLSLTSEVLEQRHNLKEALTHLETKVRIGLSTMDNLKQEEKIIKENENRIKDNKDFKYKTTKHYSVKIDCDPGKNVTHCLNCHNTCHADCAYRDDEEKADCSAMDENGNCRCCKLKCHWKEHKNTGYYLEEKSEEIEQTLENKLKEFKEATGIAVKKKDIIRLINEQYETCEAEVREYVSRCRDILQRIREIALKPDPLSELEYIEELIKTEKDDHKDGWQQRVEQLEKLKKKAETIQKVHTKQKLLTNV